MKTLRSAGNPEIDEATSARRGSAARHGKGSRWIVLGGAVAVAAVAAAVLLGVQRPDDAAHANAGMSGTTATAIGTPGPRSPAPTAPAVTAAGPATANATATAAEDRAVDPLSLPQAQAAGDHPSAPAGQPGAKPIATAASTGAAAPATTGAAGAAAAVASATSGAGTATTPPPSGSSLESLMQQAAGVSSVPAAPPSATSSAEPALPAPGSIPLKPSLGAIQGALGAALPGARACLGPDDPISHATVTFRSDGSVESVSVSGGAATKAAEGCIRAALSKARVPPFVQPTFTAPATIRPN
jgi:hypothetical protein